MKIIFCFAVLFGLTSVANAEKFVLSSGSARPKFSKNLVNPTLPIYLAGVGTELSTKDDCSKIYSDWKKAIHLDVLSAASENDIGYYLVFYCFPNSAEGRPTIEPLGYAWAVSEKGGELLNNLYRDKYFSLDEGTVNFERVISSAGAVTIVLDSKSAPTRELAGISLIPFSDQYGDDAFPDRVVNQLKSAADGTARRKIIFDLASSLRPDLKVEEINKILDGASDAHSISIEVYPILQTAEGSSRGEPGDVWSTEYKCSPAGCF